jgi:predicted GNAT family N-acyltransferase
MIVNFSTFFSKNKTFSQQEETFMHIEQAKSKEQILDHFSIRGRVFIVEQNVPWEDEYDNNDYTAVLFNAYDEEKIIGTTRLYAGKLGRVAVLKDYRGQGIGKALVEAAEAEARAQGLNKVKLASQLEAIPFYEKLGYEIYGDVFLDAGIPHRNMKKMLES